MTFAPAGGAGAAPAFTALIRPFVITTAPFSIVCPGPTMIRTFEMTRFCATAPLASGAVAQNLVISNVRIIVGPGQTIEKGAVVITNGRISAVNAGAAPAPPAGAKVIDATGMTLMAGFIDDHRHIIQAGG